jgi:cystathionine gamma-synthase
MPPSAPSTSFPLGHPIPLDEHACSVSLPTWCSVVGYEEGSPSVTEKLACGYPRFVYHPYVIQLMEAALAMDKVKSQHEGEFDCIVLPTRNSAIRCHDFLVKACGYLDGTAVSPRLVDSTTVHQIIGDSRIQLFTEDNAIDYDNDEKDVYNPNSPIRVMDFDVAGAHAVIFPARTVFAIEAKSYWQHTGEVLSSRRAESVLSKLGLCNHCDDTSDKTRGIKRVTSSFFEQDGEGWKTCPHSNQPHLAYFPSESDSSSSVDSFTGIQERIASIVKIPASSVFLTPSGMASIYAALRSTRRRELEQNPSSKGGTSIVYGFPYLDTLKMCARPELVPDGVEFFGHGNESDLQNFEQMLRLRALENNGDAGVSVLVTEFPSNPLLNCPNLQKLRELADEFDFALIVDDTIGNFANLDLINSGLADALCTSLTKLFNGRGDAMAGSVITNPNTKVGQWMQKDLEASHIAHEGLWSGDAIAVFTNSEDFLERSSKINETTEALADWLKEREEVAAIYYPKYSCPEGYNSVVRKDDIEGKHTAGYGGLFSIVLDHHVCDRSFYDKINLSKGPSLGTNFSLACPYTLLAHYHELDFALTYGVQPNLIRFAIGLEDLDEMKEKFEAAFLGSRLHPKLPDIKTKIQTRGYCTVTRPPMQFQRHTGLFGSSAHIAIGSGGGTRATPLVPVKRNISTATVCSPNNGNMIDLSYLAAVGGNNLKRNARALARVTVSAFLRKV